MCVVMTALEPKTNQCDCQSTIIGNVGEEVCVRVGEREQRRDGGRQGERDERAEDLSVTGEKKYIYPHESCRSEKARLENKKT